MKYLFNIKGRWFIGITLTICLHGLWDSEVQCRIYKDSLIIPILCRINTSWSWTYFFKVHSNIAPHLRLGLPKTIFAVGLSVKIFKQQRYYIKVRK